MNIKTKKREKVTNIEKKMKVTLHQTQYQILKTFIKVTRLKYLIEI